MKVDLLHLFYTPSAVTFWASVPVHFDTFALGADMAIKYNFTFKCWVCGQVVSLETCKTDEKGRAVHEACYHLWMQLESAARSYS